MSGETRGYMPPEAQKESKDKLLDSKYFQAMNKLYQIEAKGGSVADAIAKDAELKSTVDAVLADARWNPSGQTIDQMTFSQKDAEKTYKMGSDQSSWQKENPMYRAWRGEAQQAGVDADKVVEEWFDQGAKAEASDTIVDSTMSEGSAGNLHRPTEVPSAITNKAGDERRTNQAKEDTAVAIEAARYEAMNKAAGDTFFVAGEEPTTEQMESGTLEGTRLHPSETMRRQDTMNPSGGYAKEGSPLAGAGELGRAIAESDAREGQSTVEEVTPVNKGIWGRIKDSFKKAA